jgi:hypothetical protein
VSSYRLEVEIGGDTTAYDIKATNHADAEDEAEYCMRMFPPRLSRREGRLFRVADGRLVKDFSEAAVGR